MCMSVMPAHVSPMYLVPWRSQEGIIAPETGILDGHSCASILHCIGANLQVNRNAVSLPSI